MFSPNGLLQFLIMMFISGTVITNGILMYQEKDTLHFNNLTKYQKIYTISLVVCQLYLALILIYFLLYYLYYFSLRCCSDTPVVHTFNVWYFIYILLGLTSHGYVAYHVLFHKDYIDDNIQTIGIIFSANIAAIVFIVIVINIYKCYCSPRKNYNEINH